MQPAFYFIDHGLPIVVALGVFALVLYRPVGGIGERAVRWCMAGWLVVWSIRFWILGPASYVGYYDEADIAISRYLHDISNHLGGSFLHGIQGGTDFYAVIGFGGQYLSVERLLLDVFPLWLALVFHKLLLFCCSFVGSYLLLRATADTPKFYAFCFSAYISVFNPYAFNHTVQHGIGYAVLPLALYVFVIRQDSKRYLAETTLLSALIAASTSPAHSFSVLGVGLVLFSLIYPVRNYPKFIAALLVLPALVVLNWAEALYGMSQFGFLSARVITGSVGRPVEDLLWGAILYLNGKTDYWAFGHGFSHTLVVIAITLLAGFYYRSQYAYKISANVFLAIYLSAAVYVLADLTGLGFLNSVNFDRVGYYAIIPACLLAADLSRRREGKFARLLPALCLGFAVLIIMQANLRAVGATYAGNQLRITSIPNLKERAWEPEGLYRVVSVGPHVGFHPNFAWVYGLETLDGYTSLVPKGMVDFWYHGLHRNAYSDDLPVFSGGNMYITYGESNNHSEITYLEPGVAVDLGEKVDFNLLKLANAGYILSYFPLAGAELAKVSGPAGEYHMDHTRTGFAYYTAKIREYVLEAPDISVYKLPGNSDRAYFPEKLVYIEEGLDPYQKFRFMSNNYEPNIAFAANEELRAGAGEVIGCRKIPDGYEVQVTVREAGVFILNTFPLPYWRAYSGRRALPVFPISEIHLGVELDRGEHTVIFEYDRPLLRDRFFGGPSEPAVD